MKLVNAEEMRAIDKEAQELYKIPGLVLMDMASRAVCDVVLQQLAKLNIIEDKAKVVIYCGKGNNGGDGFGCARYLLAARVKTSVILLGERAQLQGDALAEAEMYEAAGGVITWVNTEEELARVQSLAHGAQVLVDALLGTGFSGELRPLYAAAVGYMNASPAQVVAVDLPTGLDANTGRVAQDTVKADITVTMGLMKLGLLLYPGAKYAGKVLLAELGLPCKQVELGQKYLLTRDIVEELLPRRERDAHKGDAGRIVLLAGSLGFTGAAAMASYSAVKSGGGLVSLYTPESAQAILAVKLTEVMVQGLPESNGKLLSTAKNKLEKPLSNADVLAIGPGLGTSPETQDFVRELLLEVKVPAVIDADAITALKDHTYILKCMEAPKVLTPHVGEMARLTGLSAQEINSNRVEIAAKYAKSWQAVVVLKGADTVVACPDGQVYINITGTSAMATGGSGDVLTGLIAGLAGQGISLQEAALCGVYLHGLAGELAAKGQCCLAASEIISAFPEARALIGMENVEEKIYNSAIKVVK